MSIKIILADDHVILREGLSRALQSESDFDIVGQVGDGHSAIRLIRELSPDIVIMDIGMPELNGIETTRIISKELSGVKVIGLSMHSNDKYVREMFRAGASGYLLKNCAFDELVEAIRTVAGGKTYVSPSIGSMIIQEYISKNDQEKSAFSLLSQREREVLQLFAEGKTTKQAAARLHISPKTIEAHRLNLMNKLGIDNIAQLTKYAIQEGLTPSEM
ncbi:MAG TPA: response regulator transcription factor [Anaerohalosphaeraceae bacterium]|nr:response regulator transcription factor [Anaerohalosphaeraceae bacterium]